MAKLADVSAWPRITSPISCRPSGGPCSPGALTGNERAMWPCVWLAGVGGLRGQVRQEGNLWEEPEVAR